MTMGIYTITNIINNKKYVGLSFNIEERWQQHIKYAFKESNDRYHNNRIYNALRKYGIDNFKFEIIEECKKEKLKEREIYWIDYYDAYNNGYNLTIGGDIGGYDLKGEKHPNVKLTEKDVIDIRIRYANHERRIEVYELYKDKIALRGFIKVWQGTTWPNVMMDVYTEENRYFHKHNSSMKGSKNGRAKVNQEEVDNIRKRRNSGEKMKDVYKDYEHLLTLGYFKNLWYGSNWNY